MGSMAADRRDVPACAARLLLVGRRPDGSHQDHSDGPLRGPFRSAVRAGVRAGLRFPVSVGEADPDRPDWRDDVRLGVADQLADPRRQALTWRPGPVQSALYRRESLVMIEKSLDRKLQRIHADPHGAKDFLLADAK